VSLSTMPALKGFEGFKKVVFVKLKASGMAEPLAGDSSMLSPVALSDGFVLLDAGASSGSSVDLYRPPEVYGY
ncbi:MAG: hypothetical protein DRJ97_08190, partial [Thermoprotei archaeon]